jgi:hypothetical protein
MARKNRARRAKFTVDVYLAYAVFVAVGVATWSLDQSVRLTLMWLVLVVFALIHASARKLQFTYTFSDLARGVVAGLLVSVPVLLLARDFLMITSQRLFLARDVMSLVWTAVLIMPAVEAIYFRGLVHKEKGLWPAVLLYVGAGVVYFLPVTWSGHLPVLIALICGMGLLGFVYSYVRAMYGLVSSLACQTAAHLVLLVAPSVVVDLTHGVG